MHFNCIHGILQHLKYWFRLYRYAIDIISFVIYGCDTSSLHDEDNEFRKKGLQAFKIGNFKFLFGVFFPEVLKYSRRSLYSKDVRNFFLATLRTTTNNRLQAPVQERDFVDLFIELKNEYIREENATVQGIIFIYIVE